MKLFVIGDLHGQFKRLEYQLSQINETPDLICLTGDIGPNYLEPNDSITYKDSLVLEDKYSQHRIIRYKEDLIKIFKVIRNKFPDTPIVYVPGNHDFEDIRIIIEKEDTSCFDLSKRYYEFKSLTFTGWGGATWETAFPNYFDDGMPRTAEIQSLIDDADVFISHCPPHGILDEVVPPLTKNFQDYLKRGFPIKHCGSELIKEMIDHTPKDKQKLFLCGHIHEAVGWVRHENILYLNAGSFSPPHPTSHCWMIEYLNGAFSDPRRLC